MDRVSRAWLTMLIAAVGLALVFGLLALVFYQRTERAVVERHSEDQRLLAQVAALALSQRADNYLHSADALALRLQGLPESRWSEAVAELANLAPGGRAFVLRRDGTLLFARPPEDLEALKAVLRPVLGSTKPLLTNPFPPDGHRPHVAVLVPLFSGNRLVGQAGILVSFASLAGGVFSQGPAAEPMSFSILDESGIVLANTRHPEMVGRQLPPNGEGCLPCHRTFAVERRMAAGETGVAQIQVGREPLALVAFTPVTLVDRRWSLTLSEPHSAIVADTHQGFQAVVFLLALCLVVGVGALGVTWQYRAQKRRAELAERQAALEARLRQTEQLAAIGKMTSQIAHQINTPLAALGLNVSYLHGEVARRLGREHTDLDEVSRDITAEIDRLKRVVNDYLRFSRLPEPVRVPQSLRAVVGSLLDFVEPELDSHGVRLEAELGGDPAEVALDSDLFRHAFLNLVRNSLEAMPQGGVLCVQLDREGDTVVVRLHDSGAGVPPGTLQRIFDPFFTTKKDGTGLGLAHTRRVLEQHGGSIHCASAPGAGTTFTLRLPAATEVTEPQPEFALQGR